MMVTKDSLNSSETVLVLAPSYNDGMMASDVLSEARIQALICEDMNSLCAHLTNNDCGAAIISEEALTVEGITQLQSTLASQQPWSDIPILLLTRADVVQATEFFSRAGNISLLERPFSRLTLIRSVEVALRARRRQYEVRDLLDALQRSKDEAERANIAKSQFLANMSHEIRTPIGAILGFTDLMKNQGNKPEENQQYMGIVERNSQQLLRLIDDILDLSKVEAGKIGIEKTPFKLTDLLADFISIATFKANENGITFHSHVATPIPEQISSDPVRIRQVLSNIVGNALKFTTKGMVEFTICYEEPFLRFLVKDSGIGIKPEQASRLFQPFAQADTSTTRKFGGTGLGLVLSRKLAEALGGSLELISSVENFGSTFEIKIKPDVAPGALMVGKDALSLKASTGTPWQNDLALRGLRVLLVEDSPDNQMLISTYLKKTGAMIKTASDGTQGVDKALSDDFDVVLMDVQMPELDGHAATRQLRSSHYEKPIIALTAHAMMEERKKCFESGFTDFLPKPVQPQQLIDVLSRYMPATPHH